MLERGIFLALLPAALTHVVILSENASAVPIRVQEALQGVPWPGEKMIDGVPAYIWQGGCGPTAGGMILGYYDSHGYGKLIPGDSRTQTGSVNNAIASPENLRDYAQPTDSTTTGIKPDKSQTGGAHAANSLADFMQASWSSVGNYYGWSWFDQMSTAMLQYTTYANQTSGADYLAASWSKRWSSLSWYDLTNSLNDNQPVMLLVDTEGDNVSDHYVTAIGYSELNGDRQVAFYDTWDKNVHWTDYRGMGQGVTDGIYGATFYEVLPEPAAGALMLLALGGLTFRTRRSRAA